MIGPIVILLIFLGICGWGIWAMTTEERGRAKKSKEYEYYRDIRPQTDFYMECYAEGIKEVDQIETPYGEEKIYLIAKKTNRAITREAAKKDYINSRKKAIEFAKAFYTFHRNHSEKPTTQSCGIPLYFSSTYEKDIQSCFEIETGTPLYNRFFLFGEQLYNASSAPIFEERKKEKELQQSLDKYVQYRGREKHIRMLTDYREMLIERRAGKRTINSSAFMQKEHDWAVLGGLASGIAGTAAGVATAVNAQAKNAQIRQNNARINASVYEVNKKIQADIDALDASIKSFEQSIEAATNKLVGEIDDASSKMLMNELVFSDADIAVTKTGAIKIEVEVKTKQEQSLFDGTVCAHIDGIIKAEFFSNNNAVGYAYLTLPMHGCYTFPHKINGICTSTTNPNAKYSVKYSPVSLWLIER